MMKRISLLLLFLASVALANDFEQSLVEQSSEMELVYRLRDEMLSAAKAKDSVKVTSVMDTLAKIETAHFRPIRLEEIEVVYLHSKMYKALTELLVKRYKNLPLTQEEYVEEPSWDALSAFVSKKLARRDSSKHFFHVFDEQLKTARLSDAEKKKLELLVYLNDAYKSNSAAKHVAWLARSYVNENPGDPDSPWIDQCISAPLKRMEFYKFAMAKRAVDKEDFIRHNLYTGGFGLNIYLHSESIAHSFEDYYHKEALKPNGAIIDAEVYLQIHRFAPIVEMVSPGVPGLVSVAFGLGYVVFDSRYLKVRPYVEYGMTAFYADIRDNPEGEKYSGEYELTDFDGTALIAGVNVDLKFLTTYLFRANDVLSSFSLVGKFGFAYADINNDRAWGKGVSMFYRIGLGFYIW